MTLVLKGPYLDAGFPSTHAQMVPAVLRELVFVAGHYGRGGERENAERAGATPGRQTRPRTRPNEEHDFSSAVRSSYVSVSASMLPGLLLMAPPGRVAVGCCLRPRIV